MDFPMPLKILIKHGIFNSCIIFHNREISHINQSTNCWTLNIFHFFPIIDNTVKSIIIYVTVHLYDYP